MHLKHSFYWKHAGGGITTSVTMFQSSTSTRADQDPDMRYDGLLSPVPVTRNVDSQIVASLPDPLI